MSAMVLQLVPVIILELQYTSEGEKLSLDEWEGQKELHGLGLLCECLQIITQKLGYEPTKYIFIQYADQMMGIFLRVFGCRSATAHEEAMLAIGAVTVGVVGDICRALEEKLLPCCDGIMTQLLKDLLSNQLHRSVKPLIFSCFGDITLAIGEDFEKYLRYSLPMPQSASHSSGAEDETTEYTKSLRNGILEAY